MDYVNNIFKRQQRYYDLGESYFWITTHHNIVIKCATSLIKAVKYSRIPKILDAGCGRGTLINRLIPLGCIVGVDGSAEAVNFCQKKYTVDVRQALIQDMPFADNTFDFIFCVDVIEHNKDDVGVLKELYRVLKPNGFLIITAPALVFLWGSHDEKQGHIRRYSKSTLCQISLRAGFRIIRCSYFKSLLVCPLWLIRRLKKIYRKQTDDFYKPNPFLNKILELLLNAEIPVVSRIDLPIGSSLIAVLTK